MPEIPEITHMPPLFYREPPRLQEVRAHMQEGMGFATAVHHVVQEAGIKVIVDGDTSAWENPGQGALLVGDHRQRIEYLPLMSVFGAMGREDAHLLAKPYLKTVKAIGTLGAKAAEVILPVVPHAMAQERRTTLSLTGAYRVLKRSHLPTEEQIRTNNARTLQRCTEITAGGGAVSMYPTGCVKDALTTSWYPGIGKIIQRLSDEAKNRVMIVPFRFDTFSQIAVLRALGKRRGPILTPKTQELHLKLGKQGTVRELLPDIDELDAAAITERLRRQFIEAFAA